MSDGPINHSIMPTGSCYGCGAGNEQGLCIDVYHDQEHDRLLGILKPREALAGFPGITHGGAVFTAMDCMASWSGLLLSGGPQAIWVLRSAQVKYHRPPPQDRDIELAAVIPERAVDWQPTVVQIEARDADANLLVSGDFKIVPLPVSRFLEITGLDALPPEWAAWMSE